MNYALEDFQKLNQPENIIITQHSRRRLFERAISILDICEAINNGEIIENYPDSYLILGHSKSKVIHIVANIDDEFIYLITAYTPDPAKWENDFKTRKEES